MRHLDTALIWISTMGFEYALFIHGHYLSGWLGAGGFLLGLFML